MTIRNSISPTNSTFDPPHRYRLEDTRKSRTVRFVVYPRQEEDPKAPPPEPVKGNFIVGLFPDGTPGELFVNVDKQGSEIHGWAHCWAIAVSLLFQYGVQPEKIYGKFKFQDFAPKGLSSVSTSVFCKSIVDLIMRWMEAKLPPTAQENKDDFEEVLGSIVEEES